MTDVVSPIRDDEILYRRFLANKHDSSVHPQLPQEAFRPSEKHDKNGISLFRSSEWTPEQVADAGRNRHGYHVIAVRAGDLRDRGLTLVLDNNPVGHVSIPELNSVDRRSEETAEHTQYIVDQLATIVLDHHKHKT